MSNRFALASCVTAVVVASCIGCSSAPEPTPPAEITTAATPVPIDPVEAADAALTDAIARADSAASLALLDDEITWTDAAGKTIGRAELTQAIPAPAIGAASQANVTRHTYGRVGVVQSHDGRQHMLRVWVERPAGWRLFVHHEVQSLAAPPTVTPGTGKECINPCRTVPYTPATDNERAVIAAYQALETSAHAADVANWGNHIAEEFQLVSSNSDRAFTKEERLDGLRKATFGGVSPTELLSARLYDFGSAVVMRSQHQPAKGAPLQISRVWVNRDGVWSLTLSYQTAVQPTTTPR
jgi:hypothetical protein